MDCGVYTGCIEQLWGKLPTLCNLGCCAVSLANVARARLCDWLMPLVLAVSQVVTVACTFYCVYGHCGTHMSVCVMLGLMQGGFVYLGLSVSVWYKFGSHVVKCVVARVCSLG